MTSEGDNSVAWLLDRTQAERGRGITIDTSLWRLKTANFDMTVGIFSSAKLNQLLILMIVFRLLTPLATVPS